MRMGELVDQAVELVEAMCEPDKMSAYVAHEFLGNVIARLESSVDALEEENPELRAK